MRCATTRPGRSLDTVQRPGEAAPRLDETCSKPPDFSQIRGAPWREKCKLFSWWQPCASRSRNRFCKPDSSVKLGAAQGVWGARTRRRIPDVQSGGRMTACAGDGDAAASMTPSAIGMTAAGSVDAVVRTESPPPCERTHPMRTVKPAWPARTERTRCATLADDASVFRPRESAESRYTRHRPRRGTERSSAPPVGCRSVHRQGPARMSGDLTGSDCAMLAAALDSSCGCEPSASTPVRFFDQS